jgi:transposase InsO family protein
MTALKREATIRWLGHPLDSGHASTTHGFHVGRCRLTKMSSLSARRDLGSAVFEYIEAFYNRQRRRSTLEYLSPDEYERKTITTTNND